jgi:hypothetical protein
LKILICIYLLIVFYCSPGKSLADIKVYFDSPFFPDFVVMIMIPFAPLDPYKALAVASFKTLIDSISAGLIALRFPSKGIPSTTYKGSLDALTEPIPLILIVATAPGCPEELVV